MKNPLQTYAHETRLTEQEKNALHARILTYMEYHPRQYTARGRSSSFFSSHIGHIILSVRGLTASVALAILTFTAVPYFAESAQPGDLLYAIKTGVNEPLRAITLTTATEKITFETQLLERRVAEAKLLVAEGKLDADAEERLSANIKKHSDTIQKNIEALKETDTENADVAQTEFTSVLGTTDTIVSALTDVDAESASTSTLRQVLTDARTDAEQKSTSTSPVARERILGRIEQELARAYELRASIEKDLTPEETLEVERRFSRIETLLRSPASATTTTEMLMVATSTPELATTTLATEGRVTHDYEVLSQVKTLIVYLTDASLRSRLSTEPSVTSAVSAGESAATSTPKTPDTASTTAPAR